MTDPAWRSDDFLRLLAGLAALDERAEAPASETRTAEQGIGFVPWPADVTDLSNGTLGQWRDRLDWIAAEEVLDEETLNEETLNDETSEGETSDEPAPQADGPPPPAGEQEPATPESVLSELDAIAAELGAGTYRSAAALASMRRLFAARHHPDRVAPALRSIATRRMMIANMMIDLALQSVDS